MGELVDSEEAARRLGIKLSSLYAYVSRGVLESHPSPNARRRLFDVDDLARMSGRSRSIRQEEGPAIRITTGITELTRDGPMFRGIPAVQLAATTSFEDVANLLWGTADLGEWYSYQLPSPPDIPARQRLKWCILMTDALYGPSSDLRPASVVQMARRLVATMIEVLPLVFDHKPAPLQLEDRPVSKNSLAGRLAAHLSPAAGSPDVVRAVNATLVLLADFELTLPTLAVRVAASSRANFYDAVLVGVSAASAPAHGPSSELTWALLHDALLHGPVRAMDDFLRIHGILPGFGHTSSENIDARFDALMGLFGDMGEEHKRDIIRSVLDIAAQHDLPYPRVDFALAAMMFLCDMPREAGVTILTIARTVGWIAHFLEELEEPPLRLRPLPVYLAQDPVVVP